MGGDPAWDEDPYANKGWGTLHDEELKALEAFGELHKLGDLVALEDDDRTGLVERSGLNFTVARFIISCRGGWLRCPSRRCRRKRYCNAPPFLCAPRRRRPGRRERRRARQCRAS